MKAMKIKRVLAAMGVVAAAGIVPLVTAAPAHASQTQCVNYLRDKHYVIGPRVRAACDYGAIFSGAAKLPNPYCLTGLANIGVRSANASIACKLA
ncbi:hypothetical protein P9869_34920 [Streptomyces ossamyceticus]|nr:hypothetical protein [Streptomyces ossamyceticus]